MRCGRRTRQQLLVADLMTIDPVVVPSMHPSRKLRICCTRTRSPAFPWSTPLGALVGVISQTDLVGVLDSPVGRLIRNKPSGLRVGELMSSPAMTVPMTGSLARSRPVDGRFPGPSARRDRRRRTSGRRAVGDRPGDALPRGVTDLIESEIAGGPYAAAPRRAAPARDGGARRGCRRAQGSARHRQPVRPCRPRRRVHLPWRDLRDHGQRRDRGPAVRGRPPAGRAGVLARADPCHRRWGRTVHRQHADRHGLGERQDRLDARPSQLDDRLRRQPRGGPGDGRRHVRRGPVRLRRRQRRPGRPGHREREGRAGVRARRSRSA